MIDLNIYIEKFKTVDIKKRYLIFFGILVLIFILDMTILMRPQLTAMAKINTQISKQSKQFIEAKNNIKIKTKWQEEIEDLKRQINQTRLQVIPKEEVPLVLETISHLAEENVINVDQIAPQTPNAVFLSEDKTRRYYVLAIVFKGRSSYHDFGRFINDLENHTRYFKIADFSLKPTADSRLLNIALTLNVIIYEEISL